ncbi:hypothetical protein C7404_102132 [Paraburkholderia caballeronis]|nr:hypothetical protein C7404_102132 [Paraburkholderia caballeronis]
MNETGNATLMPSAGPDARNGLRAAQPERFAPCPPGIARGILCANFFD